MPPTDREQRLQELANKNAWWASAELSLLETIREHKRKLIELPDIIRQLEAKREHVTAEMLRIGAEYDALEPQSRAAKTDREFMDWANAQDANYADWAETVRRPNY